ncbi:hypothetical protein MMC14_009224 [Varicellaria rhodocarpa]|nr:hypothetical protein [Varicellaria rhodocarpa]
MFENLWKVKPLQIDPLALITILGAEEMDKALGRLVFNRYTEYLPLLAAHKIASDAIVKPSSGSFVLYNISDGVKATDLAGWFTRWLSAQDFCWNRTKLFWTVRSKSHSAKPDEIIALSIGIVINGILIMVAFVSEDPYAIISTITIIASIIARWWIIKENC